MAARPPTAPDLPEPPAAAVILAEELFARALIEADVEALTRLVGDDWIIVGADGAVISRAAFVEAVRSGALTHSSMTSDDIRVRVYGETALVTARVATVGTYQGQPFTTLERSTDTFVRQQGRWACVLTQLTTITG